MQRESDRPEKRDGFSLMDKETYDILPLTRWLDKSGKPIGDHPEELIEYQETEMRGRQSEMPLEILLNSKLVRETLKPKGYDTEEVEERRALVGQDLLKLVQKLTDNKHLDTNQLKNEPEIMIMRRTKVGSRKNWQLEDKNLQCKAVVRTLVENMPEEMFMQTTTRRKKNVIHEEAEADQESGE